MQVCYRSELTDEGVGGANLYMTFFCFGVLARLVQVGANLDGFGALRIEKKNIKEFGGTPPPCGPQPSRECVPFVPWKSPVCPADILSNLCGIAQIRSGCPGCCPATLPQAVPGHFRGIPTTKFLCVLFCQLVSFSLKYFC